MPVDLHQHIWPRSFVEALRARSVPPRLDGWTLVLEAGTFAIDPADHDPDRRAALTETELAAADADAGLDLIGVAPSAALGLHQLPSAELAELSEAWLEGALALPRPFRAWATGLDPDALADALERGAIGLELAADRLAAPHALDELEPLLTTLGDRPLLVHPGPVAASAVTRPHWWAPMVPYVAQLHAAWWAWADGGRERYSELPVCFVALAGLGPLHGERHRARGGRTQPVDPLTFVEISSYGTQAVDAVLRVLGVDVVVHGSDRPYATPAPLGLDGAALTAIRSRNPARLLAGVPDEPRAGAPDPKEVPA